MKKEVFEKMLEEYLSGCTLTVEHDNGEGYYGTAQIVVGLESPDGRHLLGGVGYTSTFEKAKSEW